MIAPQQTRTWPPSPTVAADFSRCSCSSNTWPNAQAATIERTGDDDMQTATTLQTMAALTREDSTSPTLQRIAAQIAARATTAAEKANAVFSWVKSRVRFVTDEALVSGIMDRADEREVLVRPVDLLAMQDPRGDCDDFSMLAASLLLALGVPAFFKTVAAGRDPHTFSHVYVVALVNGELVPLDCSHGPRFGWEVATPGKSKLWPIELSLRSRLNGLPIGDPPAGSSSWWNIANIGAQTAATIAAARFGVPPQGTYITGPQGTIYRQQNNAGPLAFPGGAFDLGGNNTGIILIGALLLGVVLIARKS
ncbi:MAG: hypothetical protein NTV70_09705 [Acidobacteria bacterium]|nr:hypothetical protein [Acidobacteriota bacterium]